MERLTKLNWIGFVGFSLALLSQACLSQVEDAGDDAFGGNGSDSVTGNVGGNGSGGFVGNAGGSSSGGGNGSGGGVPGGDYDESYCTDGVADLIGHLNPTATVDSLQLRSFYVLNEEPADFNIVERWGVACSDPVCQEELFRPVLGGVPRVGYPTGWTMHYYQLASSTGTEVTRYTSLGAIRLFLGAIDTPSEALLSAFLAGYEPNCDVPNVKRVGDGFELYVESGLMCPGIVNGHRVHVSSDGVVALKDSVVVHEGRDQCFTGYTGGSSSY